MTNDTAHYYERLLRSGLDPELKTAKKLNNSNLS